MLREHIILAILWGSYCVLHSFMASFGFKIQIQKLLPGHYKYYRLFYTVFSFAGLAGIVYYQVRISPVVLFSAPAWIKVLGSAIAAAGIAIMLICIRKYFLNLSGIKTLVEAS